MKTLSGKCTSVYTLTGKAHWTTSCYIKTVEEIKKYSIIKITPEKSVAYFYIQLYNVSQKEKEKTAQQAAGDVNYHYQRRDKSKNTALHDLNTCWVTTTKQQRPRTMHAGLSASENPPTKMGRHRVKFIVHTQNGRT